MEDKKTRPVLGLDDLSFISDGLSRLLGEVSKSATKYAREGEFELAGETLQVGNDISDLKSRLDGLANGMMEDVVEEFMAQAQNEVQGEDDSLPTDDTDTIPMEAYIEEVSEADLDSN